MFVSGVSKKGGVPIIGPGKIVYVRAPEVVIVTLGPEQNIAGVTLVNATTGPGITVTE